MLFQLVSLYGKTQKYKVFWCEQSNCNFLQVYKMSVFRLKMPHLGTIQSNPYLGVIQSIPYLGTTQSKPHIGTTWSIPYLGITVYPMPRRKQSFNVQLQELWQCGMRKQVLRVQNSRYKRTALVGTAAIKKQSFISVSLIAII